MSFELSAATPSDQPAKHLGNHPDGQPNDHPGNHRVGVTLVVDGPRADIVLNRPQARNAQTPAMRRAIKDFVAALPEQVRVVVVSGRGSSFSAGLDRAMFSAEGLPGEQSLLELAAAPPTKLDEWIADAQQGFTCLGDPRFVSIAAVQGHAVGAGFQLALACDLVLVADDVAFSMRETRLGLVPDLGGTAPLVAAVGPMVALELCATGRWVGADEAVRLRLALRTMPAAELGAAVDRLVDDLLAAPGPALRALTGLLQGAARVALAEQLARERAAQRGLLRQLAGLEG